MVLTFKEKYNKLYGFAKDTSHTLSDISKTTGYTLNGLKKIFSKGEGAYFSNPESVRKGVGQQQWAQARVYASVSAGSKSAKN